MLRQAMFLTLLLGLFTAFPAGPPCRAVEPGEILADPALEARARELSRNIRCLVCQNQSIDDSDADLARDLRLIVRERLLAGDSDSLIIDFVVARYGDFVLLKPPLKMSTYILWYTPAGLLIFGIVIAVLFYRRRKSFTPPLPLSSEEKSRVAEFIRDAREPE